jgi:hypothetical protein
MQKLEESLIRAIRSARERIPGDDPKTTLRDSARLHLEEALKALEMPDSSRFEKVAFQLVLACDCLSHYAAGGRSAPGADEMICESPR